MAKMTGSAVYHAAVSAGFSPSDAVIATQIAWAESGWDPAATHTNSDGSTDYGLMQINSVHADILRTGSWSDPVANMRMARAVKAQQGWGAWVGYNSGNYKRVKVSGNPFSAGSQEISFDAPDGQPASATILGSTKDGPSIGIPNPLDSISGLVKAVTNPGLWTRIGIGWLGFVLVVLGILLLFWTAKDKVIGSAAASVVKGATK